MYKPFPLQTGRHYLNLRMWAIHCQTVWLVVHSLNRCKALFHGNQSSCALMRQNAFVNMEMVNEIGRQGTSMSSPKRSANLGHKAASEFKQVLKSAEKKMVLAECKKQLDNSALQTVYATDTSFLKYERMRRAHYFIPASEAHGSTRKHYPLQPD